MNKINYFFAALYQKLRDKKPDNFPYMNLRLIVIFNLLFHFGELDIYCKNKNYVSLIPSSTFIAVMLFSCVASILLYLFSIILPLDLLNDLDVREKDKNIAYYSTIFYSLFNFLFLMYLLIKALPTN